MKKNVKSKAVAEKRYATGTGGGRPKILKFDDTETKILSIISPKATFGDTSVSVPNISFNFGQSNSDVADIKEKFTPLSPGLQTEDEEAITLIVENDAEGPSETPKKLPAMPKKRYVKGKRLEHSIEISKQLLKIEEEKKNALFKCYEEKQKYLTWRTEYEKEKLEYLKRSVEIQESILQEIRDVKDYLS